MKPNPDDTDAESASLPTVGVAVSPIKPKPEPLLSAVSAVGDAINENPLGSEGLFDGDGGDGGYGATMVVMVRRWWQRRRGKVVSET
jgi:hypothetical protein